MAQERGIEQTKELLDFIFSLAEAIKKSTADGEFTWSDMFPISSHNSP